MIGIAKQLGNGFAPEHLMAEDSAEVAGDGVAGMLQGRNTVRSVVDFILDAGNGAVGDAARHDQIEIAKVSGDVERKSMRSNATRDVNANGGDFLLGNGASGQRPHAGAFWNSPGNDAIV